MTSTMESLRQALEVRAAGFTLECQETSGFVSFNRNVFTSDQAVRISV